MSGLLIFRGLLIAFAILLCDPSPGISQDQLTQQKNQNGERALFPSLHFSWFNRSKLM